LWADAVTDELNTLSQTVFDVRDFGAKGDGTTDDTNAVAATLDDMSAGDVLYFPTGTYLLDDWTTVTVSQPIKIQGNGRWGSVLQSSVTRSFLDIRDSIEISGLGFDSWQHVLDFSNNASIVSSIAIDSCRFRNCVDGVRYAETNSDSGATAVLVTNNQFSNISGNAIRLSADVFDSVTITGNHIKDISTAPTNSARGIAIGSSDTLNATRRHNIVISNNVIQNVYCAGGDETQGIIVYGEHATIANNSINSVSNADGDNAEGIYTKCKFASITGNTLKDAGRTASGRIEGSINVKGVAEGTVTDVEGWGCSVVGNTISSTVSNLGGINTAIENVAVLGNVIDGMDSHGIACKGDAIEGILVSGNQIRNMKAGGDGTVPITLVCNGTGIVVSDNLIQNNAAAQDGIYVRCNATSLENISIQDNTIVGLSGAAGQSILIWADGTSEISRVNVSGNVLSDGDTAIFARTTDTAYMQNVLVSDNVLGTFASNDIVWSATSIDNLTVVEHKSGGYKITSGATFGVADSFTPASGTGTGVTGDICWDGSYVYICTSANSWSRATLSTF
jgi:hypothetical protein